MSKEQAKIYIWSMESLIFKDSFFVNESISFLVYI